MYIGVMKKGDRVLSVTSEFVAIEHKSGEVDILPIIRDETGVRVDIENTTTIGFGNNIVQETVGDITVTNF